MSQIKKINHIAIVVEDIDQALAFWQDTLGIQLGGQQDNPNEEAQVAFLPVGESEIELVLPTSANSGVAKFLSKHGAGLHHICLEVEDLDGLLLRLKNKNVRLISEEPRLNHQGQRYIFIHPESTFGVLVELYEENKTDSPILQKTPKVSLRDK